MSEPTGPRPLVLDTSVAVKWYLPEDLHDEAIKLLRRAEAGDVDLLAPGTIQPEFDQMIEEVLESERLTVAGE